VCDQLLGAHPNSEVGGTGGSEPSSVERALQLVQSVLTDTFESLQTTCEALLADRSTALLSGMRMSGPSNDVSTFVAVYRLALTLITFAPLRHRCVVCTCLSFV
jgi:ABC-type Na+ efflux pump permease subunit